jgi:hypothetical protein
VFWSFAYLALRRVFQLLMLVLCGDRSKEIEILILRHQVEVLRRQVRRPDLAPPDRMVLAALSRLMRRRAWATFVVTPSTLLRWHRDLIRRRWNLWGSKISTPPANCSFAHKVDRQTPRFEYVQLILNVFKSNVERSEHIQF